MLMVLMVPMETSVTLAEKMTIPRRMVARSNPCGIRVVPHSLFLVILINPHGECCQNVSFRALVLCLSLRGQSPGCRNSPCRNSPVVSLPIIGYFTIMFETLAEIVSNERVTDDTWLMALRSEKIAQAAKPGQFVMIKVGAPARPAFEASFFHLWGQGGSRPGALPFGGQRDKPDDRVEARGATAGPWAPGEMLCRAGEKQQPAPGRGGSASPLSCFSASFTRKRTPF